MAVVNCECGGACESCRNRAVPLGRTERSEAEAEDADRPLDNLGNFVSEEQRKFLFSQEPGIAHSWAHGHHTAEEGHRMPAGPGPDVEGPMAAKTRKRMKKQTRNHIVKIKGGKYR